MSASNIEWTQMTWNPLAGCSMCSPGCARCYAETMGKRIKAMALKDLAGGKDPGRKRHYLDVIGDNGKWNGKISLIPEALDEPLRRKKPTTWFVNSMSDLFHEGVPFEFVDRVFAVMALTPHHTYQILTKRPERMAEYTRQRQDGERNICGAAKTLSLSMGASEVQAEAHCTHVASLSAEPLPGVWLGTSAEDQKRYDERRHHLLRCPAAVRFLSLEPLLGPIDLGDDFWESGNRVDWVIVGGESGPGARPCNVAWVRSIVEQCKAAGVAVFVKQLGGNVEWDGVQGGYLDGPSNVLPPGTRREDVGGGYRLWLEDKKGGDPSEWPADLRVREMPGSSSPSPAAAGEGG